MVVSPKKNFGLLFQRWSLGTQESFCKNNDILDPRGLKESLFGQFWPYKHGGVKFHKTKTIAYFSKNPWAPKSCSAKCQDTRLNNYGLISKHTSSINCVNNSTFIFTRHQPRLFLKALLVNNMFVYCLLLYVWKCMDLKYLLVTQSFLSLQCVL